MKLGLIIRQGTESEVSEEYSKFLEKAKAGYNDLVSIKDNDTFTIASEGLKVTFSKHKYFNDEYAIYQIFE